MQILINISENHYKALRGMADIAGIGLGYYHKAVLNGIVISSSDEDSVSKEDIERFLQSGTHNTCNCTDAEQ